MIRAGATLWLVVLLAAALPALASATIGVAELARTLAAPGAPLALDVRTPAEFAAGHVPGALNIPLADLERRIAELPTGRDIVVYCERGPRAQHAVDLLARVGFTRVRQLVGSMAAWREAGQPVSR